MKSSFVFLTAISCLALSSCSFFDKPLFSKAEDPNAELRIIKPDPSRYLPEGTSIEEAQIEADLLAQKAYQEDALLFAKNTPRRSSQAASKPEFAVPPLELPPLPVATNDDEAGFQGILPSLNGSNEATYIDVKGETPELPPLDFPEIEPVDAHEIST